MLLIEIRKPLVKSTNMYAERSKSHMRYLWYTTTRKHCITVLFPAEFSAGSSYELKAEHYAMKTPLTTCGILTYLSLVCNFQIGSNGQIISLILESENHMWPICLAKLVEQYVSEKYGLPEGILAHHCV